MEKKGFVKHGKGQNVAQRLQVEIDGPVVLNRVAASQRHAKKVENQKDRLIEYST